MEPDFLDELSAYVGFGPEHAGALAALEPSVAPAFPQIVERFYQAITQNPRAAAAFTGGPAQIERQKVLLRGWLHDLLSGRYDGEYLRRHARIGRTHVRIRLEQRYAIAAMNVLREGLHEAIDAAELAGAQRPLAHSALDKICDIELAIMVQTYAEDYAERIRDRERLATLGQLAGFIGHELRNPLAVMETSLHLLKRRLPRADENLARHTQRLGDQLRLCATIIASLVELARDRPVQRSEVELAPLLSAALESVALGADTQLTLELAHTLPPARVDEKQLRQVVVNLLTNAADALAQSAGDRRIQVHARREADALVLAVDDSGPGVAEDLRPRLFEPLATTSQKGLGLGLALCRRIAEKHGGEIRALRSALGGARFELRLPGSFEGTG